MAILDGAILNNSHLLTIFQACSQGFRSLRLDSEREYIMLLVNFEHQLRKISGLSKGTAIKVVSSGGAGVCLCWEGEGRWRVQFSKVKLNGILVILFLLLFCCCCCRFFLFGGVSFVHNQPHKESEQAICCLKGRGGGELQKYVRYMISRKKQPPLSGHPRGTGEWPLNGGWPLNRGSS